MTFVMVGAAATAATIAAVKGIVSAVQAKKARKKKEMEQAQLEKYKAQYMALDTSNPFANMENVYEDLTVNQQQAEFTREQQQQSQANILQQTRGVAGASGIAALAQAVARQGALDAQQAAVSIGQQEQANQMAKLQEASRIQGMERQGDIMQRQAEAEKIKTMMGMTAADVEREASAQKVHQTAGYEAMDEFGQAGMAGAQAYVGGGV